MLRSNVSVQPIGGTNPVGTILQALMPKPRRSRRNMRIEGVAQVPIEFLDEDSERIAETVTPERRPFGRIEPSHARLSQTALPGAVSLPSLCVPLATRAGSTRAHSSGTSAGLVAGVSTCFCCSLTDRAPILSWAPHISGN